MPDETRPACSRCIRLNFRCEAFSSFPVFIDGLSLTRLSVENEDSSHVTSPLLSSGPSMDNDERFMAYLIHCLFTQGHSEGPNQSPKVSPWLITILRKDNQHRDSRGFDLAVGATAAAYYGKRHLVRSAVDQGSRLYAQALCKLCDPQRVSETTMLANTLLLALYEMITFQQFLCKSLTPGIFSSSR